MGYTTTPIDSSPVNANAESPSEFNLPTKEFVGYDPKGTTTITGTERQVTGAPVEEAKTPTEPTPSETKEAKATDETVTLSPKITALARKEQAARQKEQALKLREQQLEAKLADAEKYAQLKAKLAAKDYTAAEELGLNYDEYLKHELDKQAKIDPSEQRFRKVEEELSSFKKAQEEQVIKDYQANQSLWKSEIVKTVSENEAFSTIKEMKAEDLVLQHVNDSFEEDGVELTVEQAAKDIEEALVARAEKFSTISKLKKKQEVNKVEAAEPVKTLGAPKSDKTITNGMITVPTKQVTKPFHLMSETEQIAEAIRRVQAAKQNR